MKKETKIAIIAGGTSGIGAATAKLFIQQDWTVVVAGRRAEKGRALIEQLGSRARFHQVNVADEAQVHALISSTEAEFGRIDCLFNNAGNPGEQQRIADTDIEQANLLLDTHLRGVILGMKHVAPIMIRQGSGSIINTGSIAGHQSGFSSHIYSAAKAAVIHLTKTVAAELAEYGVRVNSVSPGAILTGIFAKGGKVTDDLADQTSSALAELFATAQPLQRAGTAEDIAETVFFLADSGSFITGQDIVVDGGMTVGRTFAAQLDEKSQMRRTIQRAVVAAAREIKKESGRE